MKPNVSYIKLTKYVGSYFRMKYGDPVELPYNSPLTVKLETRLINNTQLKWVSDFSYNEVAFNYEIDGQVLDLNVSMPDASQKNEFVAFYLPESIYIGANLHHICGGTWQLSKVGVKEFRKLATREFWIECMKFVDDCFCKARARGEQTSIEAAMSDFMIAYNIPLELFESMMRQERRTRKLFGHQAEEYHSFLEKRADSVFLYT